MSPFPTIPTLSTIEYPVPSSLARIVDLAYNMWWSWDAAGRNLWATIDPAGWEQWHNPIDLIQSLDRSRWLELEQIESVQERYRAAVASFDDYMTGRHTWFDRHGPKMEGPVAYLCTEYGVHYSLPFYSGGLGILAGDHTKSASDMGIPLVACGLLYRRGYFRQEIDADGDQQHFYPTLDVRRLPVRPVASPTGGQLKVEVEFPGRPVVAAVWVLEVGRTPILMLDTDVPDNDAADRPITHTLYVRGREMRLCQELVLGVGAVQALDRLSITPSAWHVNEGHAAISVIERAARMVAGGLTLEQARDTVRARTIFTLHTPVPAGNEVFDQSVAGKYLHPWAERLHLDVPALMGLAAARDEEDTGPFDLGALAIRFASVVNGVSRRHGEVVGRDWGHLIEGDVRHVTNGVHTPTWVGRDAGHLLRSRVGRHWPTRLIEEPAAASAVQVPSDAEIWAAHQARKELFFRFARGRLRRQLARHGVGPDELRAVDGRLPADRLTLGFARRFAAYKRATLMFADRDRIRSVLMDPERPVQVVFAGKAHPADHQGQAFIRQIVEISRDPEYQSHVYVLEDYDARVARFMVQGVDVWVNNPRPPMEASGTSGMKAAINGTLNMSVLDGWWVEGFDGSNGWTFGSAESGGDWGAQDWDDAASFYDVLTAQVVPAFYERENGLPIRWIEMMRASIESAIGPFSAHRMVADYAEMAYFPLGSP